MKVPYTALVKTVDISLRMVPETIEGEIQENEDESTYEPFNYPLPLPPNCKLYHSTESKESKLAITDDVERVEVPDKHDMDLQSALPPLNSLNLNENSMGYPYDDAWNIDKARPLIQKVLLKEVPVPEEKPKDEKEVIDRSQWLSKVMEKHPAIQEVRERIYPLLRTISFGLTFNAGRKEVREKLDDEQLTQLIHQHLRFEGLKKTKDALEKESGIEAKYIDVDQSLIHAQIKEAIKSIEKIYDGVISDKLPPKARKNKAAIMKEIDERLGDIGIEDEGTSQDTTTIDIWDQSDKTNVLVETDIVTRKSSLIAGSLNNLVTKLTNPNETDEASLNFVVAFFTTYQSFTSPEILLTKLIERYHVPGTEEHSQKADSIKACVYQRITEWIRDFQSHFNPRLISKIKTFVSDDIEKKSTIKPKTADIEELFANPQEFKPKLYPPEPPKPIVDTSVQNRKNIFHHELFILDVDETEICRQLCLIDYEYFKMIKPEEFLNKNWDSPKLRHRAPNIIRMLDHFMDIQTWVTSLIILPQDQKERKLRIQKFVNMCDILQSLRNFNALHAILFGIFDPAVSRMKGTVDTLPNPVKEKMEKLNTFLSTDKGMAYRSYRELFQKVKNDSCIPFLKVTLIDLAHREEHTPSFKKHNNNNLINWQKREAIYEAIKEIQKCQKNAYNFIPIYQIQILLKGMKEKLGEDELMVVSKKTE
jgi:hypothetical protein